MKKLISTVLAICLALTLSVSLAETATNDAGYSGNIAYRSTITVTAPFGGNMEDYSLRAGDVIAKGDPLFSLSTVKVYAPFSGTVRGLQAQAGDEAAYIVEKYGALLTIEPEGKFTVSANTNNAYKSSTNDNVNRYLNEGETVYLRSSDDNDRVGVGVITAVDGRKFTVEVKQSNLIMDDTVSIYRDTAYSNTQKLASYATVKKEAATKITAEGSVLSCAVQEGQTIQRGDLLFEMVTGTLDGLTGASSTVVSPVDGVLVSLPKAAGAAVQQNDVLATLYAADDLWVEFDVDESDLDTVKAGSAAKVTLDALSDWDTLTGTVVSVAALNNNADGDAKYTAYVTLDKPENLRAGMNVSVFLQP